MKFFAHSVRSTLVYERLSTGLEPKVRAIEKFVLKLLELPDPSLPAEAASGETT